MVLGLFALAGCGESQSWRQKTILEVETPNGVVTGGSVVEVSIHWKSRIETGGGLVPGVSNHHRGEASFVELPSGKYLFALTLADPNMLAVAAFKEPSDNEKGRNPVQELGRRLEYLRDTRPVPRPYYPMLVTFDDIAKPETVKLVDPTNLSATFGEGYALKSIQLEITDEKVTEGEVEKVLGWWHNSDLKIGGDTRRLYGEPLYGINKLDFVRKAQ